MFALKAAAGCAAAPSGAASCCLCCCTCVTGDCTAVLAVTGATYPLLCLWLRSLLCIQSQSHTCCRHPYNSHTSEGMRLQGVRVPASERHSCALPTLFGHSPADSLHPGSCICRRADRHIYSATASMRSSLAAQFLLSKSAVECCCAHLGWHALSWQSHSRHWSSAVWPDGRGGADRCNTLVCAEKLSTDRDD